MQKTAIGPLETRLETLRVATAERLPQDAVLERQLATELQQSVVAHALEIGDKAPDFSLTVATNGRPIHLSWALDRGPVVVCYYRGHWCGYSNIQLQEYEKLYPEIRALGGEVLFIGPETAANGHKMGEKWGGNVPVICDSFGAAMDAYGVSYDIPMYLREEFARLGFPDVNPTTGWRLPVTATFVIDQMGVIRARHVDGDFARRMEPEAAMASVRKIVGK
jgi:peroxiredoxin